MDRRAMPPIAIYGTGAGALSLKTMLETQIGIDVVAMLAESGAFPLHGTPVMAYTKVRRRNKKQWTVLIATDHWEENVPHWADVAIDLARSGYRNVYNATPLMLGAMYSRVGSAARLSGNSPN